MTTTPPTISELREAALQCLRPLRVFAQLEELLAAATVDDEGIRTATATRARLETELRDLRDTLSTEKLALEGQVASARSSLQSVTAELRAAREDLAKTKSEYEGLVGRITGVAGG